jgi:hypothetical protein
MGSIPVLVSRLGCSGERLRRLLLEYVWAIRRGSTQWVFLWS